MLERPGLSCAGITLAAQQQIVLCQGIALRQETGKALRAATDFEQSIADVAEEIVVMNV